MKTKTIIATISLVIIGLVYWFFGLIPAITYLIGTLVGTFFGGNINK